MLITVIEKTAKGGRIEKDEGHVKLRRSLSLKLVTKITTRNYS